MRTRLISTLAFCGMLAAPAAFASSADVPLPPERPADLASMSSRPVQLAANEVIVRTDSHRPAMRKMHHRCTVTVKRMRTSHGWVSKRIRRCR